MPEENTVDFAVLCVELSARVESLETRGEVRECVSAKVEKNIQYPTRNDQCPRRETASLRVSAYAMPTADKTADIPTGKYS